MSRGKFMVIEGLDGCGKSTQLRLIKEGLEQYGKRVYLTAEPTNYETGEYIRRILSESLVKDMYLQAALFLADRLEHITHPEFGIEKYLSDGYTVVCDRYYYSSFAYQGTASDIDWVMRTNLECERVLKPDLCIFLDVNPDTCKSRIDEVRDRPELYEKDVEKMRQIRDNFLRVFDRLRDSHNIYIIDANAGVEEVYAKAFEKIKQTIQEG